MIFIPREKNTYKTERHLVTHWNWSTMVNCRKKFPKIRGLAKGIIFSQVSPDWLYNLYFKKPTFCTKIHFKTFTYYNKLISTPTSFGLIRPSSGRFRAYLLSYLEQLTFVLHWLCSSMHLDQVMCPFRCWCVCCEDWFCTVTVLLVSESL